MRYLKRGKAQLKLELAVSIIICHVNDNVN